MSNKDSNPFQSFDFESMMKAWQENPMVKSVMENEFVQKLAKGEAPDFDASEIMEAQKKNLEAFKAMNARATENIADITKAQSEMMGEAIRGVQDFAKNAKENGDEGFEAKIEEAQAMLQSAVSKMMDWGRGTKEANEDIFEIAVKRMKESTQELQEIAKKFKT